MRVDVGVAWKIVAIDGVDDDDCVDDDDGDGDGDLVFAFALEAGREIRDK